MRHRLRIAREEAGLEQTDLADLMGVARNTVGNAEKGKTAPRKIVINAWALATGVPVSWLEHGHIAPAPGDGPDGGAVPPVGLEPTTCGLKGRRIALLRPSLLLPTAA